LESSRKGGKNYNLAFARNPGVSGVLPKGRMIKQPSLSRGIQEFLESSRKGGKNYNLAFARNPGVFGVLPKGRKKL